MERGRASGFWLLASGFWLRAAIRLISIGHCITASAKQKRSLSVRFLQGRRILLPRYPQQEEDAPPQTGICFPDNPQPKEDAGFCVPGTPPQAELCFLDTPPQALSCSRPVAH
ncbi:hypothetical protein BZA05DRAFT_418518 [Tricharina praecox]|uniref:uncharacterized protein n=1 Tax=Tricharina praecox TaxID=43433 RepID=UPI00222027A7|nr:uncharacterized protein BZA05DRAFT_418518 [Tricharina praecox]KAI5852218.1 hypothetical protein BZA05DRAFT_418518 [Tricharina praecox]